ncbi:sn-glycerol-3-phosphate ABC transporter ATP-binding protein UgpC [Trichlorobacter sp.]|uniref:ABC transporter ATP-binding protein n=1 Tax=Trichlorobacter sp. TaxID=2911007 RepID=UPI002A36D2F0|nr:sn-glycerol-3-phosphate ABC transporter ATP-binding protein UgpC [Trichlorobacter sp.]MDY0385453.1 sn-glycerol-3-phosphate ABC transporter ATP-binding protein UgpC [Trichlorobacter sp.]
MNEEKVSKKNTLEERQPFISLVQANKIYAHGVQAVYDFSLDIFEREFVVFVGPSGCGKSTTLRMIAGLEDITSGELYIDGVFANNLEPKDREVSMVFQSYALYPHMTVYKNLAFGLETRHVPRDEIDERIKQAAKILEIEPYLERRPRALSGGQMQRVALGRAIVRKAKVFLMDEPLSNLDAKLRVQMRSELVKLHRQLGSTTIYVTHDQTEAMTMATRIVVMKDGRIQQVGTPKEIYDHPANVFVSKFIGSPAMNVLTVTYKEGTIVFNNGHSIKLPAKIVEMHDYIYSAQHTHTMHFGIRPEDIIQEGYPTLAKELSKPLAVEIKLAELLGNEYYAHADFDNEPIIAKIPAGKDIFEGDQINLCFDMDKIHLFDIESGLSIEKMQEDKKHDEKK